MLTTMPASVWKGSVTSMIAPLVVSGSSMAAWIVVKSQPEAHTVSVAGSGVAVGGTGVAVAVGGIGVGVGGTGVSVGGGSVAVGGMDVDVGGIGVLVGDIGVAVGWSGPQATTRVSTIKTGTISL